MPPPLLHNFSKMSAAKRFVGPEFTLFLWTLEFSGKAMYQPINLEFNSRVDKGIEVAVRVLQSERIGV